LGDGKKFLDLNFGVVKRVCLSYIAGEIIYDVPGRPGI
jgi:hypothetical protein